MPDPHDEPVSYPLRQAVGLTLAHLDDDEELVSDILAQYPMVRGEALELVLGLLQLLTLDRDANEELAERLSSLALTQAAR